MVSALPRIDRETGDSLKYWGEVDRRIEFTDVTGEVAPAKLRKRITDSHIKGPMETGWGATDYAPQDAERILLTVPTSS